MHPALSVILFTTLSGAGYGLLAMVGIMAPFGALPSDRFFGLAALGLALGAVSIGLLASTFHLGRPERALRAFTQWRTSWLSREGVSSVATYVPAGVFGIGWIFYEKTDGIIALCGILAALGAVVTVYCTAMIYRSLKPIQRWHNRWVVPNYLALALATGLLWLTLLLQAFGQPSRLVMIATMLLLIVAATLKLAYWRFIDGSASASTAGTATGLGRFGEVRLFEAPHTSENYLQKEMGFVIARKHAAKLRRITLLAAFALPLLLTLAAILLPGIPAVAASAIAAPLAMVGVVVERWLFFAEAKHSVTLYYGAASA
jgi:DMSO reductase anchor subunit